MEISPSFLSLSVSLTVLFLYKLFHLNYEWEGNKRGLSFLPNPVLFPHLQKACEHGMRAKKNMAVVKEIRFLASFTFFKKKMHICKGLFSRCEPSTVKLRQSAAKALTEIPLGILEHNNKKQTSRSS